MAAFEPHARHRRRPAPAARRRGRGDICEEFTYRLPGYVFAEFFNLTPELGLRIRAASREFNLAVQDFVEEDVKRTSLRSTTSRARSSRCGRPSRSTPRTTRHRPPRPDRPLPEDMLLGTIRQFIVVGMIAPSVFIGSMVIHLSENAELQRQLRDDPSLIPAAVEEYLRLLTPYRGFARTPTRDVEIRGRLIRKDEPVAVVFASANRDEDVFPSPTASSSTARTSAATSRSGWAAPLRRRAARRLMLGSRSRSCSRGRRRSRSSASRG